MLNVKRCGQKVIVGGRELKARSVPHAQALVAFLEAPWRRPREGEVLAAWLRRCVDEYNRACWVKNRKKRSPRWV